MLRTGVLIAVFCASVVGQGAQTKDVQVEAKGLPPRVSPAEYQAQAKAGALTVAAEFKGHMVPTMEGTLSTDEYVVVEAALFGPPGTRIQSSAGDFSLRINGRKTPLPGLAYPFVLASIKDPEWEPPDAAEKKKSKTKLGSSGEEPEASPQPAKVPVAVLRSIAQRVEKAAFPEGDRELPEAGLVFFEYRGKPKSIQSVELIYTGPSGKATLALQP